MMKRSEHKFFRQLLEGVISIGLVLLFFFIIMSVLNLFFPTGAGFSFFIQKQEITEVNAPLKHEQELHLSRNGQDDLIGSGGEWAARITSTNNEVKSKRGVDIAWRSAETGMKLYNQDAVQTLNRSTALIYFDDQNEIDLGENSLIVIRRMEHDLIFKEKRSYMVVIEGELRGRMGGAQDDGVYLEVTTPNAVTRLQNVAKSDVPLEFRINVEDDNSSSITLFSGQAEVEAQGETIFLEQGQITRILGNDAPSAPIAVPEMVKQLTPTKDQNYVYRSLPPQVELSWESSFELTEYHLQLARDRKFSDIVLDERLKELAFMHGNLQPGDYFWRISGLRGEDEGNFSPVRKFRLIQDKEPPQLEVRFPQPKVTTATVEVTGKSESGSQIFISGQRVESADNGDFQYMLPISRGMNVIVIEAIDQAGNISFDSKIVTGVY